MVRFMTTIEVKVKPSSRVSCLESLADGTWYTQLKSRPVDGKANMELVALVAKHFGVPKGSVTIKTGTKGRRKLVIIDDAV
jgi:hypothetical protein